LAKQVKAGYALEKAASVAEHARPDVSLAADLVSLEKETHEQSTGSPGTSDFELALPSGDDGMQDTVHAHRAIIAARSTYLRELVLAAPETDATGTDDSHSMPVPDTLDLAELRAAVRMCYVGEAQSWAVATASKQLAAERRIADLQVTEATAADKNKYRAMIDKMDFETALAVCHEEFDADSEAAHSALEVEDAILSLDLEADAALPQLQALLRAHFGVLPAADSGASHDPEYPPEWESRVGNLSTRFSNKTRAQVIEALITAQGHGGTAAGILQGRKGRPTPDLTWAERQKERKQREELKAARTAALTARRLLEAKLESDLAEKFGISFVRNLKRPDDRQISQLFGHMMKEHLLDDDAALASLSEDGVAPPAPAPGLHQTLAQKRQRLHGLSLDQKWEVLQ